MARNSKYTPQTIEKILTAIKETGSDKAGYGAGGINQDTFYAWKNRYSEFSEGVARAKAEFRSFAPESFIQQAKESLINYLFNGAVETWSSKEFYKDADGNIIKTVERVSKVVRPTPPWVIDHVLGKNIPVLEAMQVLLTEGVATPDQARIIAEGISRMENELKRLPASNGNSTK